MGLGDGFLGKYNPSSHGPLDIGLDAAKGAPLAPGRVYFATDSATLYYDEGDSWLTIGQTGGATTLQAAYNGGASVLEGANGPIAITKSVVDATNAINVTVSGGTGLAAQFSGASISCPQGSNSERFGAAATTSGNARNTCFGNSATATSTDGTSIGYNTVSASNSIALGSGAAANTSGDTRGIAIGHSATAGQDEVVIGASASGTGVLGGNAIVIGSSATCVATSTSSIVIGKSASVGSGITGSIAIGTGAGCAGVAANGVAIGNSASSVSGAVVIGGSATTSGPGVIIGNGAQNNSNSSNIVISGTAASGSSGVVLGGTLTSNVSNVIVIGTGSDNNSHASNISLTFSPTSANKPNADGQFIIGSDSARITDLYAPQGFSATALPSDFTIHATGGSGVGIAGASLFLAGGISGGAATAGGNVTIQTARAGSGTSLTSVAKFDNAGNTILNPSGSALTTNATAGFVYLPSCAGTPSGTPGSLPTGAPPMVIDTTANKVWAYYGGAWHSVGGSAGVAYSVINKSGDFTASDASGTVYNVDVSGAVATRTATLPTAASSAGFVLGFAKSDSSGKTLTIATSGGDTIFGGANTVISAQYTEITVVSDGVSKWVAI